MIAEGTPAELKARVSDATLVVQMDNMISENGIRSAITPFTNGAAELRGLELVAPLHNLAATADIIRSLAADATLDRVSIVKPTMDDVFFELTGRPQVGESETKGLIK